MARAYTRPNMKDVGKAPPPANPVSTNPYAGTSLDDYVKQRNILAGNMAARPAPVANSVMAPQEAGLVAGLAAIAKLLGASNQDINAAYQGYTGVREEERNREFQNQQSQYNADVAGDKINLDLLQETIDMTRKREREAIEDARYEAEVARAERERNAETQRNLQAQKLALLGKATSPEQVKFLLESFKAMGLEGGGATTTPFPNMGMATGAPLESVQVPTGEYRDALAVAKANAQVLENTGREKIVKQAKDILRNEKSSLVSRKIALQDLAAYDPLLTANSQAMKELTEDALYNNRYDEYMDAKTGEIVAKTDWTKRKTYWLDKEMPAKIEGIIANTRLGKDRAEQVRKITSLMDDKFALDFASRMGQLEVSLQNAATYAAVGQRDAAQDAIRAAESAFVQSRLRIEEQKKSIENQLGYQMPDDKRAELEGRLRGLDEQLTILDNEFRAGIGAAPVPQLDPQAAVNQALLRAPAQNAPSGALTPTQKINADMKVLLDSGVPRREVEALRRKLYADANKAKAGGKK